jgi:hypothetical protein
MTTELLAIALAPSLIVFVLGCILATYRTLRVAARRRPYRIGQGERAG